MPTAFFSYIFTSCLTLSLYNLCYSLSLRLLFYHEFTTLSCHVLNVSLNCTVRNQLISLFQVTCKCRYDCRQLSADHKEKLFLDFHFCQYDKQCTYLLGLLDGIPVQRRRHGSYRNPDERKRQSTVILKVPNGTGQLTQVCKQTSISIFAVTKNEIHTLVRRKKWAKV